MWRLRLPYFHSGKRRDWFVEFGWERGSFCYSVDLLGFSHNSTVLPSNERWVLIPYTELLVSLFSCEMRIVVLELCISHCLLIFVCLEGFLSFS